MYNVKDFCRQALEIQGSESISEVTHTFASILPNLRGLVEYECIEKREVFTREVFNRHPVCVMFASKIGQLAGSENYRTPSEAFEYCQKKCK